MSGLGFDPFWPDQSHVSVPYCSGGESSNAVSMGFDDFDDRRFQDDESGGEEIKDDSRKGKRFRLTHGQTRFLMSEFARQAHPDAAHRERLASEIPGISPRQIQVWFQNRRAKLKRLPSDDRERMMRSRALPADFDTTQTLQSPLSATSSASPPMMSPSYSSSSLSRTASNGQHASNGEQLRFVHSANSIHHSPNNQNFGSYGSNYPGNGRSRGSYDVSPTSPISNGLVNDNEILNAYGSWAAAEGARINGHRNRNGYTSESSNRSSSTNTSQLKRGASKRSVTSAPHITSTRYR